MMSKEKYPHTFSRQMVAIVFIIFLFFAATVLKLGNITRVFPSFNLGIFSHRTR